MNTREKLVWGLHLSLGCSTSGQWTVLLCWVNTVWSSILQKHLEWSTWMPSEAQLLCFGARRLLISPSEIPSKWRRADFRKLLAFLWFSMAGYSRGVAHTFRYPTKHITPSKHTTPQWWHALQKKEVVWLYWNVLVQCWKILKSYILNQYKHCKWHIPESSWHLS